ncbi:ABC transporter permease [Azospirillum doebereinerae]|uniref:ABC transporter permease n=1 Tax=Azospirillum doebereinerae TaxID=92933 RepID=A0A433JB02_9PROT|nr:ABC transporter permease [Azospirillum doebereinerae]MCG5243351.1 ABC transporter permease [Azospirillum doebereinerae]RUQ73636.1 ABC transporter permease [Azospirillum doebereinerae]
MLELLSFGPNGWGGQLLTGTAMTVAVAVSAFAFGIVMGSLGASAKLSHSLILNALADVYTTVVRGIPELLVIYLLFFGGNGVVSAIASAFGYDGRVELNAFTIGVVAVGLISGAYSTEVIRGAVRSVPFGQIEAARACGMGRWLILRRVLVPQTMRFALPGLGNVWQLTLKDTALVSVTALAELMRATHLAAGATREPFLFYSAAAVLYLALTTVSTILFDRAEQTANRGVRRA